MHYFIISFLEYHLEEIVSADYSQIPSIISQLTIKNPEMIDEIFENAKKIRAVTPYSYRLFFSQLDIFKPFSRRHKELFEHYQPENLLCMPLLPSEIFYIAYNKIVSCPDKNCKYFNNLYDSESQLNYISSDKNLRDSDSLNDTDNKHYSSNELNDSRSKEFLNEKGKNSSNDFEIVNKQDIYENKEHNNQNSNNNWSLI